MAYATGLRLIGALCMFSVVGIPLGLVFWYKARKVEQERKHERRS